MPRERCDICQGRETIELSVTQRGSIIPFDLEAEEPTPIEWRVARRSYPCPECQPAIQRNKFCVVSRTTPLERFQMDDDAFRERIEHSKLNLGAKLGMEMATRRLVHFDFTENAPHLEAGMSELVATIGVASPVDTLTFQARVDAAVKAMSRRAVQLMERGVRVHDAMERAQHTMGRPV